MHRRNDRQRFNGAMIFPSIKGHARPDRDRVQLRAEKKRLYQPCAREQCRLAKEMPETGVWGSPGVGSGNPQVHIRSD
jgi:hypothetical protein